MSIEQEKICAKLLTVPVIAADEDYLLFVIGPAIVHVIFNPVVEGM